MRYSVPHPIPYQGSKRRLATAILCHVKAQNYHRLVEPFAGSAAVTLAAATGKTFSRYLIADKLEPLTALWELILKAPESVSGEYRALWERERKNPIEEYYAIRAEFNLSRDPVKLLYLLVRCVKNAFRFNPSGEFNQSPDKRRTGTNPNTMEREIYAASRALVGKTNVVCADFMDVFSNAEHGDFVYLDPPYQGTSEGKDSRYFGGVARERLIAGLEILNKKDIPFILSYDGWCGNRTYGDKLPSELASRVLLNVGRSSQATLNGHDHVTIESLYLSHNIANSTIDDEVINLSKFDKQHSIEQLLF